MSLCELDTLSDVLLDKMFVSVGGTGVFRRNFDLVIIGGG